jgi:hypothetical protein
MEVDSQRFRLCDVGSTQMRLGGMVVSRDG